MQILLIFGKFVTFFGFGSLESGNRVEFEEIFPFYSCFPDSLELISL